MTDQLSDEEKGRLFAVHTQACAALVQQDLRLTHKQLAGLT